MPHLITRANSALRCAPRADKTHRATDVSGPGPLRGGDLPRGPRSGRRERRWSSASHHPNHKSVSGSRSSRPLGFPVGSSSRTSGKHLGRSAIIVDAVLSRVSADFANQRRQQARGAPGTPIFPHGLAVAARLTPCRRTHASNVSAADRRSDLGTRLAHDRAWRVGFGGFHACGAHGRVRRNGAAVACLRHHITVWVRTNTSPISSTAQLAARPVRNADCGGDG